MAVLDTIRDRGANIHANRVFSVIRKMLNFAVERGVIDLSPAQQIKQTKEQPRDCVLDDDAIRTLWAATVPYRESSTALPMHHVTRCALRLLLLTGQRNSEVCGLRHDEIADDIWTIPAKRTKNGLVQTVPLSWLALETLETAKPTSDDTYLFPSNSKAGHITNFAPSQAMQKLFDGQYRPHDLRRTVGTRLSALGFNRLILDKVLNHKDTSVGGIYDRYSYDVEKREALEAWASELSTILR